MSVTEGVVAVAGEALVDLVPLEGAGQFQAVPGGSPANVAVGLARLGTPARMLARIGADPLGRRVREYLRDNGVGLDYAVDAMEPTSLAVVDLDGEGVAHYDFRIEGTADWQWTDAELEHVLDGQVAALHTGSLALMIEPGGNALLRLVERARDTVTVSYDPNARKQLMNREATGERVRAMLELADVVKVSAEDLAWLRPGWTPEDALADWITRGPALVVVTLGGDGSIAATAADPTPIHRPGKQIRLVDTVGAGDAFTSGLLSGLHRRDLLGADRRPVLRELPKPDLTAVLDEATLTAALTCTRRGANPPTAEEIRQYRE
ncbi:carbohydrate kinase family protein [Nocardia terpenica]|uniref:Carbohydrate kinase n=1 Tax=Nocardia terpenica TaxID=455432 RepID=A0A6G9YYX0_9NOCA|nr:carbohydrate kinase [Nocardia terpenica]QIS18402.1 carbohydrate kinase [Nocardia terpenica]